MFGAKVDTCLTMNLPRWMKWTWTHMTSPMKGTICRRCQNKNTINSYINAFNVHLHIWNKSDVPILDFTYCCWYFPISKSPSPHSMDFTYCCWYFPISKSPSTHSSTCLSNYWTSTSLQASTITFVRLSGTSGNIRWTSEICWSLVVLSKKNKPIQKYPKGSSY